MSEEEADALALVAGARAGPTPSDIYGTALGKVLADLDSQALSVTGIPTSQSRTVLPTFSGI